MNRNLLLVRTLYVNASGKYIKLKVRLDKAIHSGRFYSFSQRKQHSLLSRLRKLFEKVKSYHTQLKLTGVGAAIALALTANPAEAQSTLGPFVQADNKNPLPPPYRIVAPRPAPVDIDNDGDLDVFVGDKYGNIHFFRNNAGAGTLRRLEKIEGDNNPADFIQIYGQNASPTFADVDGDGDFDLLVGSALGTTHFFRNTGTRTAPIFTEVLDSSNPFDDVTGMTKYSSFGPAHPTFVNLDGDSDLDLVVGSSTVSYLGFYIPAAIKYYENVAGTFTLTSNALFDNVTYENNVIPIFTDIDGDGDLDMFAGMSGHMRTFITNGDGQLEEQVGAWDATSKTGNAFEYIYSIYGQVAPAFVDFDDDGDLDFVIGRGGYSPVQYSDPILYIENDGDFALETQEGLNTTPFDGVDVNQMARVTFDDLDGDLDLDAVIGSKYTSDLIIYANTDGDFIQDSSHPLTEFNLDFQSLPTFVDIDGDGDLDLLVGTNNSYSYFPRPFFFKRNTDGTFEEQEESPLPESQSFAFFDIDNDGDLDAFTTESGRSIIRFYENTGSVTNPIFVEGDVPAPFFDLTSKYGSYVTATDFDHDGDMDIVISVNNRLGDYIKTKFNFFENNGDETFTEIDSPFDVMTTENDHISFADIDDDGDDDILLGFGADYYGGENGTFRYFENQNPQPVTSITTTTLTINGAEPVVLDPTLTIVDEDSDDIVLATITIGDYIQGEEFLAFNTPPAGVTGVFDTQSGVLTFSGKATLAQYQSLLRTVTYEFTGTLSTDAAPVQSGRKTDVAKTITFAVRDTDFTLTTVSIVNLNILSGPLGELRVFNAVSANGDALNSHFRIEGLTTPNKVTIVNRWGDQVYEMSGYNSDDTSKRFEGKSDGGKDLPTGTYYYTIEVSGKKVTGFLSLRR